MKIDVNVVPELDAVRVGVRFESAPLEVFTADETSVDVEMGEGNRAQLFKIEIKKMPVDRVEVRAAARSNVDDFL